MQHTFVSGIAAAGTGTTALAPRHATIARPSGAPHRQRIAVVGSGISGMASAWLLSQHHDVTVYEKANRFGGHSHTVDVVVNGRSTAVDTGFIVYNEACYPNLSALFRHFDVATRATDMSLAISFDAGRFEYGGDNLNTLFAQRRNLVRPRFWAMLRDLVRFYREAPRHLGHFDGLSIGDWLTRQRFGAAFRDDHLLPMAASIWSASPSQLLDYPAEAFVQFCENHGLLRFSGRPQWRTVSGGSIEYVKKLTAGYRPARGSDGTATRTAGADGVAPIRVLSGAASIARLTAVGQSRPIVAIRCVDGSVEHFDAVVMASHADETLALLDDPSDDEHALLQTFRYADNRVLLHSDTTLMPQRRNIWSSWNYLGSRHATSPTLCLTYWMNRLQHLDNALPLFVTLNPARDPQAGLLHKALHYRHPIFNVQTLAAQQQLWTLQGRRATWFCGAYFGAGFHEDGLQAGLHVAEALGGVARPWQVDHASSRIHVSPHEPTIGRTAGFAPQDALIEARG